jgi:hypothetical protein
MGQSRIKKQMRKDCFIADFSLCDGHHYVYDQNADCATFYCKKSMIRDIGNMSQFTAHVIVNVQDALKEEKADIGFIPITLRSRERGEESAHMLVCPERLGSAIITGLKSHQEVRREATEIFHTKWSSNEFRDSLKGNRIIME